MSDAAIDTAPAARATSPGPAMPGDGVRWLDERESEAWRAVRELGQPLWAALGRELQRDSGLSNADYEVLVVLSAADHGILPYRELARSTEWEKSRLSHHVTRMEQRGLVARQDCPDDARAAHIVLTDVGRRAIERAAPGHVAAVRRILIDGLTPDQLDVLASVGRELRARLAVAPPDCTPVPDCDPAGPAGAADPDCSDTETC